MHKEKERGGWEREEKRGEKIEVERDAPESNRQ